MLAEYRKNVPFAPHAHQVFVLQFFQMMRQRDLGMSSSLRFSHHQALGMGREQELHDAKPGFGAHSGETVGVFRYVSGLKFGLRRASHISTIAEIRKEFNCRSPEAAFPMRATAAQRDEF